MVIVEHWRPVVGYEERYEVSDRGRVRSLKKRNGAVRDPPLVMSLLSVGGGYRAVCFGREHRTYVHRLVLEAFVGPCPLGMEACHWDGNRAANHADNLRWDTRSANRDDARRHGTLVRGERMPWAVLTDDLVRYIRSVPNSRGVIPRLVQELGVSRNAIRSARMGLTWKHVS